MDVCVEKRLEQLKKLVSEIAVFSQGVEQVVDRESARIVGSFSPCAPTPVEKGEFERMLSLTPGEKYVPGMEIPVHLTQPIIIFAQHPAMFDAHSFDGRELSFPEVL